MMGRDKYYRPTVLLEMNKLKDFQNKDIELSLFKFFTSVKENLLFGGKVETWNILIYFDKDEPFGFKYSLEVKS